MSMLGNYTPPDGFHPIEGTNGAASSLVVDTLGHVAPNADGPIVEILKRYLQDPNQGRIIGYVLPPRYGFFSGQHITTNSVKAGPWYSKSAAAGAPFSELKLLRQKRVSTVNLTGSAFTYDAWDLRSGLGMNQFQELASTMTSSVMMAVGAAAVRELDQVAREYVVSLVLPYCIGKNVMPSKVLIDLLKYRIDAWGCCSFPEGLRNLIMTSDTQISDQQGITDTLIAPPSVVALSGAIHPTEIRTNYAGPDGTTARENGPTALSRIYNKGLITAGNSAEMLPGYSPANEFTGRVEIGERYFSKQQTGRYNSQSLSVQMFDDTRRKFVAVDPKDMLRNSGRYNLKYGTPQSPILDKVSSQFKDPFEFEINGQIHVNSFVGCFELRPDDIKHIIRAITDSFEDATSYAKGSIVFTLTTLLDQVVSTLEEAPFSVEFFQALVGLNAELEDYRGTQVIKSNAFGSLNLPNKPENVPEFPTVPPGYANANGLLYLASLVSTGEWNAKGYDQNLGKTLLEVVRALKSLVSYLRGISKDNPLFSALLISDIMPNSNLSEEDSAFVAFVQNAVLQSYAFPIYLFNAGGGNANPPIVRAGRRGPPIAAFGNPQVQEGNVPEAEQAAEQPQGGQPQGRVGARMRERFQPKQGSENIDIAEILRRQFARSIQSYEDAVNALNELNEFKQWFAGVWPQQQQNDPQAPLTHLKWLLIFGISVTNFKEQFKKRPQGASDATSKMWEALKVQAEANRPVDVDQVMEQLESLDFGLVAKIKVALLQKLKSSFVAQFNAAERVLSESNPADVNDIRATGGVDNMYRSSLTWSKPFSANISDYVVAQRIDEFGNDLLVTISVVETPYVPADTATLKLYKAKPDITKMTNEEHRKSHPNSRIGSNMTSRAMIGASANWSAHTNGQRTSAGVVPGIASTKVKKTSAGAPTARRSAQPTKRIGASYGAPRRYETIEDLMAHGMTSSKKSRPEAGSGSKFGEQIAVMDSAFTDADEELLTASQSAPFEEALYYISKFRRGFNQIVGLFYVFCKNNLETMDNFIEQNIPLPFEFLEVRPWMCYLANSAILVASGGRTGVAYLEIPQSFGGIDSDRRIVKVSHGTRYSISVIDPTNLWHLSNVHIVEPVYGCNTQFFAPFSGKDIHQLLKSGQSIISIVVPKGYSKNPDTPDFFDITGALHFVDEQGNVQIIHATPYPGMDFVHRAFQISAHALSRRLPMEIVSSLGERDYARNTVAWDGVCIHAKIENDGSVSYPIAEAELGTGHWKKFGATPDLGEVRFAALSKVGGKY